MKYVFTRENNNPTMRDIKDIIKIIMQMLEQGKRVKITIQEDK